MYDAVDIDKCVSSTNIQKDYFNTCMSIAHRSNLTHKHGCIIVKDGVIISKGYNYKLSNDSSTRYKEDMKNMYSIHAEVSTIKKVKKKDLRNCEMYVVRIGPSTNVHEPKINNGFSLDQKKKNYIVKYSHPCQHCSDLINQFGIRRVYYSVNVF